jgi:hypothetical protein
MEKQKTERQTEVLCSNGSSLPKSSVVNLSITTFLSKVLLSNRSFFLKDEKQNSYLSSGRGCHVEAPSRQCCCSALASEIQGMPGSEEKGVKIKYWNIGILSTIGIASFYSTSALCSFFPSWAIVPNMSWQQIFLGEIPVLAFSLIAGIGPLSTDVGCDLPWWKIASYTIPFCAVGSSVAWITLQYHGLAFFYTGYVIVCIFGAPLFFSLCSKDSE